MKFREASRLNSVKEYYFSRKLAQLGAFIAEGRSIINLGIGSPDMAPDNSVVNALNDTAREESNHGYQSYKGLPELRKAIAGFYERTYGIDLKTDKQVLPLMGSKEGIMHLSLAFLEKGDEVLLPDPGYPAYSATAELAGASSLRYNLRKENHWQIDLEELENLRSARTKLIWINYPHMPTGTSADPGILKTVLLWAKRHSIIVVNDNPYSLLSYDKAFSVFQLNIEESDASCAFEGVIELNSLSKSHNMAGWRIGMMLGDENIIQSALKVKSNMDSGMFKGLQIAASEALNLPANFHDKRNEVYVKRRAIAEEMAGILACTFSEGQGGLFLWMEIPDSRQSAEEFSEEILEKTDVFITPGFIFGKNGERFLRISLCSKLPLLQEALERLKTRL